MHAPEIVGYVHNAGEIHVQFKQSAGVDDLVLVNFGRHKTPPGYTYGPVMRDFALIHLVIAGRGTVVIDQIRYTVRPGQCFLLRPNQIHYYQSDHDEPWEYYYIGFCGARMQEILSEAGFTPGMVAKQVTYAHRIQRLLAALCTTVGEPIQPLLQHGYLCQVLHYLVQGAQSDAGGAVIGESGDAVAAPNYAHIAAGILHHSYPENITVDILAQQLGISRGYLNTLFRQKTGKSIYQYLLEHRIRMAGELLRMTDKPVKRIALEVGFCDPMYFSRIFRKHVGITPSEHRRLTNAER